MAKGWARHLAGDCLKTFSGGTEAHGVNPRAVQVMKGIGNDISEQRSDVIHLNLLEKEDVGITLCSVNL